MRNIHFRNGRFGNANIRCLPDISNQLFRKSAREGKKRLKKNAGCWPKPELKEIFGAQTESVELTLRLGGSPVQNNADSGNSSVKSSVKIVQEMRKNPHVTVVELASLLGISERAVWKNIAKLKASGAIRRIGADVNGEWEVLQ